MNRLFAFDGRLARTLLEVFQVFLVSVQVLASAIPATVFVVAVGWQATHLALWLGVLSLVPIAPSAFAALAVMRTSVDEHAPAPGMLRRFWVAWLVGARRLAWWWALLALGSVMAAYSVILTPTIVVMATTAALAAIAVALTVALSFAVIDGGDDRATVALRSAMASLTRRPHVAAAWIMIVVVCSLAVLVPVIGPSTVLFLPGAGAWAICVVDRAFTRTAPATAGD